VPTLAGSLQAIDVTSWAVAAVPTTGPEPTPRHGHSITIIGDSALVFGGADGGDILRDGTEMTDLHRLGLRTLAWSTVATTPSPTALSWSGRLHSATAVGTKLLILGGNSEVSRRLAVVDPATSAVFVPRVTARGGDAVIMQRQYNHNAVVVGTRLYVYGGWAEGPVGRVYALDLLPAAAVTAVVAAGAAATATTTAAAPAPAAVAVAVASASGSGAGSGASVRARPGGGDSVVAVDYDALEPAGGRGRRWCVAAELERSVGAGRCFRARRSQPRRRNKCHTATHSVKMPRPRARLWLCQGPRAASPT